ncbi:hypothetical protein B6E66_13725 [Streptomyces maremycinicus]|nr:hypothetical protein B6E66_13725 [Streptomyces sp. B9173]
MGAVFRRSCTTRSSSGAAATRNRPAPPSPMRGARLSSAADPLCGMTEAYLDRFAYVPDRQALRRSTARQVTQPYVLWLCHSTSRGNAMSGTPNSPSPDLRYEVFVSDMVPAASPPAPDGGPSQWSSLSHTLIYGPSEALLTDPPITRGQADALIQWLEGRQVPLRYIYLTHGHADHYLTTNYLLHRFPEATVVATEETLSRISRETPYGQISDRYINFFGDALPEPPVTVSGTAFPDAGLELDGQALFAHKVGHSDTDDTSVLHAPSLDLVVAGDVVYNNVHQYVGEGRDGGLDAWHRALDIVADLRPRSVVASHKDTRRSDSPSDIDETRRYLEAAAAVLDKASDATQFFNALKEQYPDRVNPWAIWLSARRLFPN